MTRATSRPRPITGSIRPARASAHRSRQNSWSAVGFGAAPPLPPACAAAAAPRALARRAAPAPPVAPPPAAASAAAASATRRRASRRIGSTSRTPSADSAARAAVSGAADSSASAMCSGATRLAPERRHSCAAASKARRTSRLKWRFSAGGLGARRPRMDSAAARTRATVRPAAPR